MEYRCGAEDWRVTLIEIDVDTMSDGSLRRMHDHLGDRTFCLTYGDEGAVVDLGELFSFRTRRVRLATVTAGHPLGRLGARDLRRSSAVRRRNEKVGFTLPMGDDIPPTAVAWAGPVAPRDTDQPHH